MDLLGRLDHGLWNSGVHQERQREGEPARTMQPACMVSQDLLPHAHRTKTPPGTPVLNRQRLWAICNIIDGWIWQAVKKIGELSKGFHKSNALSGGVMFTGGRGMPISRRAGAANVQAAAAAWAVQPPPHATRLPWMSITNLQHKGGQLG